MQLGELLFHPRHGDGHANACRFAGKRYPESTRAPLVAQGFITLMQDHFGGSPFGGQFSLGVEHVRRFQRTIRAKPAPERTPSNECIDIGR